MRVNWFLLIGFIITCNLIGAIGTIWTSGDGDWYKGLEKPSFNPPSFVFAPIWTMLFSLIGVAFYFVWISEPSSIRNVALVLFGFQFLLNILWSYLFFGLNNLTWSLVEIVFLLIIILLTGVYFYFVNFWSGVLILPYFVWVLFASVLNWWIWRLN